MILSFTGRGSGVAKLASIAFMELKSIFVPVLPPEWLVHHYLPYSELSGKAYVFALGNPSDTLRVAEGLKLTSHDVILIRPPLEGLHPELRNRLEVYEAVELPQDPVLASLEAGKFAIRLALEGSEGFRAKRLAEDLENLETELELPERFDMIVYTESMELAALTLAELEGKPTVHFTHAFKPRNALILTTSAEEAWVRRLARGTGNKILSLPYDPLISSLSFLASLKKLKVYSSYERR